MLNPFGDNRGRLQHLISSPPDDRDCNRVESHCLSIQGFVVNARPESSGRSHATSASPSDRTGSSSCGSRRSLRAANTDRSRQCSILGAEEVLQQ
jgi:hypothetical protein